MCECKKKKGLGTAGVNYTENIVGTEDTACTLCWVCQECSIVKIILVPLWTSGQILCQCEASGKLEPIISFSPKASKVRPSRIVLGLLENHIPMCCCWQGDSEEICSQADLSWGKLTRLKPITVLSDPRWHSGLSLSIPLFEYICLFLSVWSFSTGLARLGCLVLSLEFSVFVCSCLSVSASLITPSSLISFCCLSSSLYWHEAKLVGQH